MASVINMTAHDIKRLPNRIPQWGLPDRLRKVRRDIMGLTQAEISAELGVGLKAYSAWEAGTNAPGDVLEVATKLEKISGVPRQWTIGWLDERDLDYGSAISAEVVSLDAFRAMKGEHTPAV